MTLRRCQVCATFYDKKAKQCPECATAKYPANEALISQRWASNLNAQAEHAVKYG